MALSPSAFADHIFGRFQSPEGLALNLSQRGLVVTGTLVYPEGRQVSLSGRSDGGDYVTGTVSPSRTVGSFELLFQPGQPATVDLLLYRGTFEAQMGSYRLTQVPPGGRRAAPPPPPPREREPTPRPRGGNDDPPPPERDEPRPAQPAVRLPYGGDQEPVQPGAKPKLPY
jgi:hypothetical protein